MATRRRGLGRGLEALIGNPEDALERLEAGEGGRLENLPVDKIQRGRFQPRVHFDPAALEELAESIRRQGVLQPVVVRPVAGGWELVAGERRWRAAQLAGLDHVPAVVRELDDAAAAAIALIENLQRENLNPLEQADALKRLIDEFGMTHQQAAEAVGRSRAAVTNLLRLRELEPSVKAMLGAGQLEMGHARALLALDPPRQREAAHEVVRRGLSVRQTEALVRRLTQETKRAKSVRPDADLARLERELADHLGARVQLQAGRRGGRLVVHYRSHDELDGILRKLGAKSEFD